MVKYPMESLNAYFETLGEKPCITVIGCGGKTSLIGYLAAERRHLRTLVTTTTRMALPPAETRDYFRDYGETRRYPPPSAGITVAGVRQEQKLLAIPPDVLEEIVSDFDATLIEGDGSRMRPLKGWAEYEPVVPPCTTATVGILPLWTIGKPVSEDIIHRLPFFTALTSARPGETITPGHLVSVITGNYPAPGKGLFSAALGKRVLFFNQVETAALRRTAQEVVSLLPRPFLAGMYGIIAGSVHAGTAEVIYE